MVIHSLLDSRGQYSIDIQKVTTLEAEDDYIIYNGQTLSDIVGKLSYMMRDRVANQKKADRLLGKWKTEVVADQQAQVVHNFYCMAHALLGFHSYAKKQLSEQQKEMKKDGVVMGRYAMPVFARFGDTLAAERLPMHVNAIVWPLMREIVCRTCGPHITRRNTSSVKYQHTKITDSVHCLILHLPT